VNSILKEENKFQDFEILKFRRNRNEEEAEWRAKVEAYVNIIDILQTTNTEKAQ
jgi:hypothetical protein